MFVTKSTSQTPAPAEIPFAIDILINRIPQLAPPVRFTREITIVYWTAIGAWVCGGVLVALARRAGALAEVLGWAGVVLLYAGAALIGLLLVAAFVWAVITLLRARKILLGRLETTYLEERRLVDALRPHPTEDLEARARFVRLQAQLFDRIALIAGLIATAATAASSLFKAWGDSGVWKSGFESYKYFPAALVVGICLVALVNLGRAQSLMRAANLYEEASATKAENSARARPRPRRPQLPAPKKPRSGARRDR